MDQELDLEVSVPGDADPDAVIAVLQKSGAKDVAPVEESGLTGIELVLAGVLVAQALGGLAIGLAALLKCGVIVDARGSVIYTREDCKLPRGTVLVFGKNDTRWELHKPSRTEIDEAVAKALAG